MFDQSAWCLIFLFNQAWISLLILKQGEKTFIGQMFQRSLSKGGLVS